jgi:membrane protease YdiL (CAAX protease family)
MSITQAIIRLIAVTLVSVLLSVMAMISVRLSGVDLKDMKQRTNPRVLAIALFFNLLFIVSVALILKFWDHQPLGVLGLSFGSRGLLFVLFVCLFSAGFAFVYVRLLHSWNIVQIRYRRGNAGTFNITAVTLFGFVVLFVAALQEEILFRGYFSFVLLPYGFWAGMLISTMAFTLWHFLTNKAGIFQTADWLMGGIMLFFIYWISGSIWVAALTHFSRNITNVLIFDISGSGSLLQYDKPIKPLYKSVYTILFTILVMLTGYVVFGIFS